MKKNGLNRALLRRILSGVLAALMCTAMIGCMDVQYGNDGQIVDINPTNSSESGSSATRAYQPIRKEDGSKFRIAYVDIDPYNPTFRLLYFAIESLKADGWITYDELPYDPEVDGDTQGLINWLIDNAQSDYLEFVKEANYYTYMDPAKEAEISKSLREQITGDPGIDVVITMGTGPSALAKSLELDVPILMYGVADPIGAGLINSVEDSGADHIWAHVDPSVYSRQLQYYYDTFEFTNIGAIYDDEIVASMPEYRQVAEQNGFKITEYQLSRTEENEAYYKDVESICRKMVEKDKIDAFVLITSVLSDVDKAKEIFEIFFDADIPVFAQVGLDFVQEGACLMMVDTRDAVGLGPFFSNIIGSVLNGSLPGDLEQEFVSSPYLTLNLDVADMIDFKPTYEMLIACEKIICSD